MPNGRRYIPDDNDDTSTFDYPTRDASIDSANGSCRIATNTQRLRCMLFDQQRTTRSLSNAPKSAHLTETLQGLENREDGDSLGRHGGQPGFTGSAPLESSGVHTAEHYHLAANEPESNRDPRSKASEGPSEVTSLAQIHGDIDTDSYRKDLETSSDSGGDEQGVNETEAPAPIQETDRSGSWRREETLEQKESSRHESDGHYKSKKSSLATQTYIISYLIFFSIWGTLARLGVQWLTFYPGAPVVISNLWANFAGTLFMGFLAEDQNLFRDEWGHAKHSMDRSKLKDEEKAALKTAHGKMKKTIPLYVGLSVGFCGSFTSFSTFMRDAFFALANDVATPLNHPGDTAALAATRYRNKGYSVTALLAIILLTLGMTFFALRFGAHLALAMQRFTLILPFRFLRKILDRLMVFLALGSWLGAVFMTIWPPDRRGGPLGVDVSGYAEHWRSEALFACCFAPVGCLVRYFASVKLNSRVPWFPMGTFAVNMFGIAVLGMCYDLQHVDISGTVGGSLLGCQVLQGVEDGFCGALTTVSTWVVELHSLKRRHAYLYGSASIIVGLSLLVAIMGSVQWSIGFSTAICKTETS